MSVLIVIPTYNESQNIGGLLAAIAREAPDVHVLVVDDASPDGTARQVQRASGFGQRVFLLERGGKQGLGAAYRAGFAWGMERGYDVLGEMDADFSHAPEDVPRLLAALDDGADMVIGSRKIAGGGVEGWNWWRKFCSGGAMVASRFALGLRTKDVTAGFRFYRRELLEKIRVESLKSNGYAFQEEVVLLAERAGARIGEVPVLFKDRVAGESKLGVADIREFFFTLLRLIPVARREFFLYAAVGLLGSAVDITAFLLLVRIGVPLGFANVSAVTLAVLQNFALNHWFTFAGHGIPRGKALASFVGVSAIGLLVNTSVLLALVALSTPLFLAKVLAIAGTMAWNYSANRWLTFADGGWRQRGYVLPLVLLALYAGWQNWLFNPYWGYDGGAHLAYINTLAVEHRFPTVSENYLAWHEPLYYLWMAAGKVLGIPLSVMHFAVILALIAVIFVLARAFGQSSWRASALTVFVMLLPAFAQVSLFYTNEALAFVWFFVLVLLYVRQAKPWLFAVAAALAILTKVSAMIPIVVVASLLAVVHLRVRTAFLMLACAMLAYAPWIAHRQLSLPGVSINNYDLLPAVPLWPVGAERATFFATFDPSLFQGGFWYAGGKGYTSMLYADFVSDYYGFFENQDRLAVKPVAEKVLTTQNNTWASSYRKDLARLALLLGLFPVLAVLFGLSSSLRRQPLVPLLFVACLAASLYYSYRYPYPEMGVVKAIFIAPGLVLPLLSAPRFPVLLAMGCVLYASVVFGLFCQYCG